MLVAEKGIDFVARIAVDAFEHLGIHPGDTLRSSDQALLARDPRRSR